MDCVTAPLLEICGITAQLYDIWSSLPRLWWRRIGRRERKRKGERKKEKLRSVPEEQEQNSGSTKNGVQKSQALLGIPAPVQSVQDCKLNSPKAQL